MFYPFVRPESWASSFAWAVSLICKWLKWCLCTCWVRVPVLKESFHDKTSVPRFMKPSYKLWNCSKGLQVCWFYFFFSLNDSITLPIPIERKWRKEFIWVEKKKWNPSMMLVKYMLSVTTWFWVFHGLIPLRSLRNFSTVPHPTWSVAFLRY